MPIDHLITDFVVCNVRAPWLTPLMEALSNITTAPTLIVMLIVLAAFVPGRRAGWFCTLNIAGATLLNQLLKAIVRRPRPDVALRLVHAGGYSFPSGHSMAAMAFFGLLIWLAWRTVEDKRKRALICAALGALIVLIGFSRIYLGVHYFTDVIAGFAISFVWLAGYTKFTARALLD